jgi:hypothetical protein
MRRSIVLLVTAVFLTAAAPAQESGLLRVYVAGESSTVSPALDWAGWGIFVLVDDPAQADVLLLNGEIPDADLVRKKLSEEAGLVLILGPQISSAEFTRATGVEAELQPAEDPVHPLPAAVSGESVDWQIDWESAPAVEERSLVLTPLSTVRPLISASEDGQWLIWGLPGETAFVVDFFLGQDDNPQFRDWEYYNYLIYQLVIRAASREPLGYAEYPGAIIPGSTGSDALIFGLVILVVAGLIVLFIVRRTQWIVPEEPPESDPQAKNGQGGKE